MKQILFLGLICIVLGFKTFVHAQVVPVITPNYALKFDGIDDYVSIPTYSDIELDGNFGTDSLGFSISFWLYPTAFETDVKNGVIIDKTNDATHTGYAVTCGNAGSISFVVGYNGAYHEIFGPSGTLQLNKWQHVDCFYDRSINNMFIIHVNGNEVARGVFKDASNNPIALPALPPSTDPLRIGSHGAGSGKFFTGMIDEVKISNKCTEGNSVKSFKYTFFENSNPGTHHLVAYYKFNNTSGNTLTAKIGSNGTLNDFTNIPTCWVNLGPFNTWERSIWYSADGLPEGDADAVVNKGSLNSIADLSSPTNSSHKPYVDPNNNLVNLHQTINFDGNDLLFTNLPASISEKVPSIVGFDGTYNVATQFYVYKRLYQFPVNNNNIVMLYGENPSYYRMGIKVGGSMVYRSIERYDSPEVGADELSVHDLSSYSIGSDHYLSGNRDGNLLTNGAGAYFYGTNDNETIKVGGIGNNSSTSLNCKMLLSEIIVYSSLLDTLSLRKVQTYLSLKYGTTNILRVLANPNDYSYPNYYNSDGDIIYHDKGYWYDIFGIGKDSKSGLDQLKSGSFNTLSPSNDGAIGKGAIILEKTSPLNDGQFLILGRDTASLIEQTSELPSSQLGNIRFAREWKVSNINNIGGVNLYFDTTGLCLPITKIEHFKLLVDIDGDGDFTNATTTFVPTSILNNDQILFENITLPHNAVFTFLMIPFKATLSSPLSTTNQTVCGNNTIVNITYDMTDIAHVTGLPTGVTASYNAGVLTISGTPTVSGVFNYSIHPNVNYCSPYGPFTGVITIDPIANLTETLTKCGTYTWRDGVTYTASNTTATHTVSGVAAGGCDSVYHLNLTINPLNTVASAAWPVVCQNTTLTPITRATTGATGIGVATNLPDGVTAVWSANTITISGTPTNSGVFNYSITLTGGCGNISANGVIQVNPIANLTETKSSCTSIVWRDGVTYTTSNATATHTVPGVAAGGCDSIYHLNLTISAAVNFTETKVECGSYTWRNGVTYTANNSSATFTVPGAAGGCDSVYHLNLTIQPVNSNYQILGFNLIADATTGTFQWINCNTGTAIPGATNATFALTTPGVYALVVSAPNGCVDTSACYFFNSASIEETDLTTIAVYPNPTNGEITIEAGAYLGTVILKNALGQIIDRFELSSAKLTYRLPENKGVYFFVFEDERLPFVKRVVKQ